MSSNAASLRRILHSIGAHAVPPRASPRSTGGPPPSTSRHEYHTFGDRLAGRRPQPVRGLSGGREAGCRRGIVQLDCERNLGRGGGNGQHAPAQPGRGRNHPVASVQVGEGEISRFPQHAEGDTGRSAGSTGFPAAANPDQGAHIEDASEARDPSEASEQSGPKIRKLKSRIEEAKHADDEAFKAVLGDAAGRDRDGINAPFFREDGEPRPKFFQRLAHHERGRLRASARRNEIELERHGHKERKWQDILRLLESTSPSQPGSFAKRVETIKLPEGIFAAWTRDPGESVLHIMQQTGSHVQVMPGPHKTINVMSELTLFGTPSQNEAAKQILQSGDLLQAISPDDLNASKSMSDYNLRVEVPAQAPYYGQELEQPKGATEERRKEFDEDEDFEQAQLENAVDDALQPPTRAVWQMRHYAKSDFARFENDPVVSDRSVNLTNQVRALTAPKPRLMTRGELYRVASVRDELVKLLTAPENACSITNEVLVTSLQYLARHMFFPDVRAVLDYLDNAKVRFDNRIFGPLLEVAAQAESTHNFHYLIYLMRKRNLEPTAITWSHFHALVLRVDPASAGKVLERMQKVGAFKNYSARIAVMEEYARVLMRSYLASYPDATVRAFIEMNDKGLPGIRWMTTFYANQMIAVLLEQGKASYALTVVDELVSRGGRPNSVTLNTFLVAARLDGNLETAVAVLRKFHDLRVRAAPMNADQYASDLAETDGQTNVPSSPAEPLRLPCSSDVSVTLNAKSFKQLLTLAWERKHYNAFRVFWRYACCAGHVDSTSVERLRFSTWSRDVWALEKNSTARFAASSEAPEASSADLPTRDQLWEAWIGRFALGVDDMPVEEVGSDEASTPQSGHDAEEAGAVRRVRSRVIETSRSSFVKAAQAKLRADLASVGSVRPTLPLVEMAETAWQEDRAWKRTLLGLPKCLRRFDKWRDMYKVMVSKGVDVPVVEGDGTRLRV